MNNLKGILFSTAMVALLFGSCKNKQDKAPTVTEKSWSTPALLSDSTTEASCVFLTYDQKQNPLISWVEITKNGQKNFYFACWDAQNDDFGVKNTIPMEQNASIHEEGMPKIAVKGDGTIFAMYEASVPKKGTKWGISNIRYVESHDGGKTWTQPQSVFGSNFQSSYNFANLTRLADGEIGVSGLGEAKDENGRPVYFARTVKGQGFSRPILIEEHACECCRTAISSSPNGKISIVYRNVLPGSIRDISLAVSTDGGTTFSKPNSFSNDQWQVNGCPHNGPAIVSTNRTTYVAWYSGGSDKGVHYAELDNAGKMSNEKSLSTDGRFVQLAVLPNNRQVTTYSADFHQKDSMFSKIMVNRIESGEVFEKTISLPETHGSYPVVTALSPEEVVVAWKDDDRIYYCPVKVNSIKDIPSNSVEAFKVRMPGANLPKKGEVHDPVCGMTFDASLSHDSLEYKGKKVHFCSGHCEKTFQKHPEKYEEQLGIK